MRDAADQTAPERADVRRGQGVKGEPGIIGVMLESFLAAGRQDATDRAALTPGQSITDASMGWDTTAPALRDLAFGIRARCARIADREHLITTAQST